MLSTKAFCEEVLQEFGEEYLREPTAAHIQQILKINSARGFPVCLGSIDCKHCKWKSCPVVWAGPFKGKEKKPTIVFEAISDGELWIWHYFFESPSS